MEITKIKTNKIIILGIEGLAIAILITYIALSKFNKLTLKETLKSTETKIIFIAILIYAIITFINQQKILNTYSEQEKSLNTQIAEASEYQNKLNEEKDNVNSPEYIEAIAREKLDMYLPNERVYVDQEN